MESGKDKVHENMQEIPEPEEFYDEDDDLELLTDDGWNPEAILNEWKRSTSRKYGISEDSLHSSAKVDSYTKNLQENFHSFKDDLLSGMEEYRKDVGMNPGEYRTENNWEGMESLEDLQFDGSLLDETHAISAEKVREARNPAADRNGSETEQPVREVSFEEIQKERAQTTPENSAEGTREVPFEEIRMERAQTAPENSEEENPLSGDRSGEKETASGEIAGETEEKRTASGEVSGKTETEEKDKGEMPAGTDQEITEDMRGAGSPEADMSARYAPEADSTEKTTEAEALAAGATRVINADEVKRAMRQAAEATRVINTDEIKAAIEAMRSNSGKQLPPVEQQRVEEPEPVPDADISDKEGGFNKEQASPEEDAFHAERPVSEEQDSGRKQTSAEEQTVREKKNSYEGKPFYEEETSREETASYEAHNPYDEDSYTEEITAEWADEYDFPEDGYDSYRDEDYAPPHRVRKIVIPVVIIVIIIIAAFIFLRNPV